MRRDAQLLALVGPALAEADAAVADAVELDAGKGLSLSCRKGCVACCYYLVRISVGEALHIRSVVASLPEDHRERVRERAAEIRAAADEAELTADLLAGLVLTPDDPGEEARLDRLSRRYLALGQACPFLEGGTCSIYENRPTPCRQHCVTSDPVLCADPFASNVRAVPLWPLVRDRLVRECAEITGEPPRMVPLAFVV